jgi:kynureninase
VATPRDASRRGAHVALRHARAALVCASLREADVIADHRPPDILRLGLAPLYTRFVDVWDAFTALNAR